MAKRLKRNISRLISVYRKKPKPKPKPKSVFYSKTFSSWVTKAETPRDLRYAQNYLRNGLKTVRRIYGNFDAAHGFDARYLKHWPDERIKELKDFIPQATRLQSGEQDEPYSVRVRPRTKAQEEALRLHTSQASPDEERHPQRAFVIYGNVAGVRARFHEELVAAPMGRPIKKLRVEVARPGPRGYTVYRDYLFREVIGFQPGVESASSEGLRIARELGTVEPWQQMVIAMQRLVRVLPERTRTGHEAHYRLLTDRGLVYSNTPRHFLVDLMQKWGEEYDSARGFPGTLIGVRFQGDEFAARKLGVQADKRRARYAELAYKRRLAMARISPTGALLSPPKKKRKTVKRKTAKKQRSKKKLTKAKRVKSLKKSRRHK